MHVSVIIPHFNRPIQLERAIRSVVSQTYACELIVVDDGSSLDFSECKKYLQEVSDVFIEQKRSGVSAARNAGIQVASGDWLAFLDSDDYWLKDKLQRQVAFHKENTELLLSQTEERWIRNGKRVNKKNLHKQPKGDIFSNCLKLCCVSPSSVMIKKEVFKEIGLFDQDLPACEDYDLWLRIAARHNVGLIESELVVKYGGAEDQLSRQFNAMDRFRLYSLLNLYSKIIDDNVKKSLIEKEILNRSTILLAGATKRSLSSVDIFQAIINAIKDGSLLQTSKSHLSSLKQSWQNELSCYQA